MGDQLIDREVISETIVGLEVFNVRVCRIAACELEAANSRLLLDLERKLSSERGSFGLLCWHLLLLLSRVVEVLHLPDDGNEEARGVLVMGQHSEAPRQLCEDLWAVVALEHGLFEAPELVVISGHILEAIELLEIV